MSDASLVAGQIQDVASSIDDVANAIRSIPAPTLTVNLPEQSPPNVNVTVPAATPPTITVEVPAANAPDVNVSAPDVTVHSSVNVPPFVPVAYAVEVTKRDELGFIKSFTIVPVTT